MYTGDLREERSRGVRLQGERIRIRRPITSQNHVGRRTAVMMSLTRLLVRPVEGPAAGASLAVGVIGDGLEQARTFDGAERRHDALRLQLEDTTLSTHVKRLLIACEKI